MRRVLAKSPFRLTIPSSFETDAKQCNIVVGAGKSNHLDGGPGHVGKSAVSLSNTQTVQYYSFKSVRKVATARLARSVHCTSFYLVSLFIVASQIENNTLELMFTATRYT